MPRCSGIEMNVRLKLEMGRVAFVAGLGSTVARLIFVSSAFAQEPTPTPFEAEVEPVIVTGSYIPTQTAAEVGANPVQVIDRYTIEKSGERNTEELRPVRKCFLHYLRSVPHWHLPPVGSAAR